MQIVGNDVSGWQGDIDFDTLKNNANFIIFKDTEGAGFEDPQFKDNQEDARLVGLPLGYYHFARPDLGNSAEVEADSFLNSIGQLHEGEVLTLDFEVGFANPVQWCKDFLDHIYLHTKTKALIYLNKSEVRNYDWSPVAKAGYGLWLACYDNNLITGVWDFVAIQQWTNAQTVPGINGKVDGDYFFGTVDQFKAYGYHRPPQSSPSASISPSSSQSASYSPTISPSPSVSPSSSISPSASLSISPSPSQTVPTPSTPPPVNPAPAPISFITRLKIIWAAIKAYFHF